MESITLIGVSLVVLLGAIIIVSIKNRGERQERDIELERYKTEMDKLEGQLKRKEITKDKYDRLRKNFNEEHQKIMINIRKWFKK